MANNNAFQTRKDGSNPAIPVAGYESGTDAIISKVEQLAKVSNTQTTSGTGQIQVSHVPIAAVTHYLDHQGNLTETYGITATDAGNGTTYYVGSIDPNVGTFVVYSDSRLTTPVTNTGVNYSHYFLAPVLGTLNSDGTITQNVSLTGRNAININQVSITANNTAQALPNVPCNEVTIIALKNGATVYVGTSNVSNTTGVPFNAGDSQTFPVTNLDMLYIYGTAGDGVAYVAS